MDARSITHAGYWRNALADAELGKGALTRKAADAFYRLPFENLATGRLPERLTALIFGKLPETTKQIDVRLRPYVYVARTEHGQAPGKRPDVIAPLITRASVDRDGMVRLEPKTWMARDLLSPLDGSAYTIGSMASLDAWMTRDAVAPAGAARGNYAPIDSASSPRGWSAYDDHCWAMLEAVCTEGWPGDEYELTDVAFIEPDEGGKGSALHLLPLYDDIRTSNPEAPLFERYAADQAPPLEACLPAGAGFAERLAHSGPDYALADAQRSALAHLLVTTHGEIVAVNGPPGTGKTTLLLSVVATLWAEAAIRQVEPPIVVAASTNNQAVTNIIDAFGSDFSTGSGPFAGRWLPELTSFGAFYPASTKEKEAAQRYQTASFFEKIESQDYVEAAEAAYLIAADAALPELVESTLAVAVTALHARLVSEAARLGEIETAWRERDGARAGVQQLLGDDPQATMSSLTAARDTAAGQIVNLSALATAWSRHLADEPLMHVLLGWLPSVARQRERRGRLMLEEVWPADEAGLTWNRIAEVEPGLAKCRAAAEQLVREREATLARATAALQALTAAEIRCANAIADLASSTPAADMSLADCDRLADRTIRFEIFLLATHYWEGRWLLDMRLALRRGELDRPKTLDELDRQWRRRLKLTPCVVSTFYTLPRHLSVSRQQGNGWTNRYLYDHVDLLIVDEAGQVTPEVAGGTFALARRALVIGDTLQIEPIWSVGVGIDIGNLTQAGLLPESGREQAYAAFAATGKSSASGSVMHIAQHTSRYHQEPLLARGLMLLEHRRCFDEIVGFCNALCYHGLLQPLRGSKARTSGKVGDGLPAMGYLHIDGICLSGAGNSRYNMTEAETIARWLAANREQLEMSYRLPLSRIIGIVTPFGAQQAAIVAACAAVGIKAGGTGNDRLTVGTVHALQGAQRLVVLFSAVYTKHADGGFIDQSSSMLNVAVSRAMNSFLLFGDMDVMAAAAPASPRGQLAAFLTADPASALAFEVVARHDLEQAGVRLQQLRDAAEHDAFLKRTIDEARETLVIVTPWIRLDRIREIGALERMQAAVGRDVAVTVYTDRRINLEDERLGSDRSRRIYAEVAEALRAIGVSLLLVEQVHSKIVIADDQIYCVGSFNWFSAQRTGPHVRVETSLVYRGDELRDEIDTIKASLKRRALIAAGRSLPVRT